MAHSSPCNNKQQNGAVSFSEFGKEKPFFGQTSRQFTIIPPTLRVTKKGEISARLVESVSKYCSRFIVRKSSFGGFAQGSMKVPQRKGGRSMQDDFRREFAPDSRIFSHRVWLEIGRNLRLSKRELEIVRGIFDDYTEFAIADDLGISPHTVHTHVERLHRKLAIDDRAALILRVVSEFLKLTDAPESRLPAICGKRTAGLCHLRD